MEALLIFGFVFWCGARGAARAATKQAGQSVRSTAKGAAANGRAVAAAARAAKRATGTHIRTNGNTASRSLLWFGTVIGGFFRLTWSALRSTARGVKSTGQAAAGGWREGWTDGKQRAADRATPTPATAVPAGCPGCAHGTVDEPPRRDCPCDRPACPCVNLPIPLVKVTGGNAVGSCSACGHRYAAGRVDGCHCGNDRCPCRVAGTNTGANGAPIQKAQLTEAQR